jgi:lipopolysaccharide/colanic/teichoic acid biosynthesis glycosyltransferase
VNRLVLKRAIDVVGAAVGLVVAGPVLAAGVAAVALEDGRPVIFRQARSGLRGEPFTILKLRTMVRDAGSKGAGMAVDAGDDRILRCGHLLRVSAVDELPQLWNVLRGEMSLIGPRPTLPEQIDAYTDHQRRRLDMKPGLTGWSQVHGRTSIPWSERIELDVWYVENWSLALDLRILWMTVAQLLRPHETYKGETGGFDL